VVPSGVLLVLVEAWELGFAVGLPNSERTQQDRTYESERDEHRQDIQLQGVVHVRPPSLLT
jgi:hypothetical protein